MFVFVDSRSPKNAEARADSSPDPSSARKTKSEFPPKKLVSVLPNPNPQKIVWQNRVHRIGTRIPSVSPLEKPDLARHHHTEKRKLESRQIKIECVVARRGRTRNSGSGAEHHFWCSVERTLSRDGIRIGAYDLLSHYRARGACHIHYLTLF